jgi:hypothetical protein
MHTDLFLMKMQIDFKGRDVAAATPSVSAAPAMAPDSLLEAKAYNLCLRFLV